jgi:hypothetical protein
VSARAAARAAAASAVEALRAEGAQIIVALASADRRTVRQIATGVTGIDFVIQGGLDQADPAAPSDTGGAHLIHAGRQGQRLVVIDVYRTGDGRLADRSEWTTGVERTRLEGRIRDLEARIAGWERDGTTPAAEIETQRVLVASLRAELAALGTPGPIEGNAFVARIEELAPEAARDAEVTAMMEALSGRVNEHNRTALAHLVPPPVADGEARYVGSAACRSCHEPAYAWWHSTPHGRAYQTLVDRHKQFDLSCVGCHVTGYRRPGGSTVTHNLDGALVDVGCENCHGAGSRHVSTPDADGLVVRDAAEPLCVRCHNPDHSDRFHYGAYRSMLIAPGHGQPAAATAAPSAP